MKELEIREEICRLVSIKGSTTYSLDSLSPSDLNFVRCANRRVRAIDGDTNLHGDLPSVQKWNYICQLEHTITGALSLW